MNVFARSHYLPLFSRLGDYSPALLDRVFLHKSERYTEYLPHEAAFMPMEDWALWRFRMERFRQRWHDGDTSWEQYQPRTVQWILDELRDRGPLRPADLRDDAPREGGGWWNWDVVKTTLESLWRTGDVAISGRRGFERHYALAEQVIPAEVRDREVSMHDAVRELVRRAAISCGVATIADLNDYYRLRSQSLVRTVVQELADAGELQAVQVEGWTRGGKPVPAWMHRDAVVPRKIRAATVLTPFDPLVWFRERAQRMFDLDYRIEIYTPAPARRFGYYSLPVLVDDRIAARVDLKADRQNSTLLVQSAWWEPHGSVADSDALADALTRAARWQGLERVSVSGWGTASESLFQALSGAHSTIERHRHEREGDA